MKRIPILFAATLAMTSCQENSSATQVVSQTFVHKYGFETTEKDWAARDQDGQVVATLKSGVKVTSTYENGKLHGSTTHTFPHSSIVEKLLVYDQGTLLKERVNDASGMPMREELYEYDYRKVITLWDEKGVPLSIEEYEGDVLTSGKYFTAEHDLEGNVEDGIGTRVKRDRAGQLISKDEIANGSITARTTYHPNGSAHTVSHYRDHQLHGKQLKFAATGRPLMELDWENGVLDGVKTVFRNGSKVAVIPYALGQKHGTELHFDDLGNLTAEIDWRHDKKHGTTKLHSEEESETTYFFNGQSVSAEKFKVLETREHIVSEFNDNQAR